MEGGKTNTGREFQNLPVKRDERVKILVHSSISKIDRIVMEGENIG